MHAGSHTFERTLYCLRTGFMTLLGTRVLDFELTVRVITLPASTDKILPNMRNWDYRQNNGKKKKTKTL